MGWTPELREAVREERAGLLSRAVSRAMEEKADALVLPGNLWDADTVSVADLSRLLDALASFAPRPVLIAPGRHDAQEKLPFAEASFRSALGLATWPENVHLFASRSFTRVAMPGRDDVAFLGRAADGGPLPEIPPPPAPLSVLVASVEGDVAVPEGWAWGAFGGRTAPCEVREKERVERVERVEGVERVRGAFSGAPVPASFDGPRDPAFLLVRLAPGEEPGVRRLPSSGIRFLDVVVDVEGLEEPAVLQAAALRMQEAGAGPRDAVRLTLTGSPALRAPLGLPALPGQLLHLALRDATERPSPGEALATAEARFAAEMKGRIAEAKDEAARRTALLALALGRAALAGRALAPPRREEIGPARREPAAPPDPRPPDPGAA